MFYAIRETLQEISREELNNADFQYVAAVSFEEWIKSRDSFLPRHDLY